MYHSHETRDMNLGRISTEASVIGHRMRSQREALAWSQEKVGVEIGIDESASRARISRYELGTHEPPVKTARLIAKVLGVPLAYLYCEDDDLAELLLAIQGIPQAQRGILLTLWLNQIKQTVTILQR